MWKLINGASHSDSAGVGGVIESVLPGEVSQPFCVAELMSARRAVSRIDWLKKCFVRFCRFD